MAGRETAMYKELSQQVENFLKDLTPSFLETEIWHLLRTKPGPDGGIDLYRLVRHFLNRPDLNDVQTGWAYQRMKPVLLDLIREIPSLHFYEGD